MTDRIYQSNGPDAIVYANADQQKLNVLYGGVGAPDGPGHGHITLNGTTGEETWRRPSAAEVLGRLAVGNS
jgi:hypothetical protein